MWKLRDIVLAVIFSVVCGAIYMGWDYLTMPLFGTSINPAIGGIVNGMWWIAAGLVAVIIRRPGAALFAGVVSALFEFIFGSPYGPGAIISGLVQGGGMEIGLILLGWRRWNAGALAFAAAIGGIGNVMQWLTEYGGDKYPLGVIIGYTVLTLISGAVIAGLLPSWIGGALKRSGVVRNFAIGRESVGARR